MTAADRLRQAAEDIRALAGEHAPLVVERDFRLAELILRTVADCLDPEEDEEREAA